MRRAAFLLALAMTLSLSFVRIVAAAEFASIDKLVTSLGLGKADVGFILVDLASGKSLAERNAGALFLPASVTKLVTAFAALQILGPGHRFVTVLLRRGNDLYLQGGGDPVLTTKELQSLALQLKAAGGAPIASFFYDDSALTQRPEISDSQPIAAEYNCGVGALTLDFNRVEVLWSRSAIDAPLAFHTIAPADDFDLPSDWIGFQPAPQKLPPEMPFLYAGAGKADRWLYATSLPDRGLAFLPVRGTSLQTALVFAELAEMQGMKLPQPAPGRAPANADVVGLMESPPLAEIIPGLMRYSNNSTAELIGLAASRALKGKALALGESAGAIATWLEARQPGSDWRGFDLENHSGLSAKNRVSPRQMAAILGLVAVDNDLVQSLPPLDDQGLPELIDDPSRPRHAQAKSGTMDYASALAGFLPASDGRRLAFAIFVFDRARRAAFDRTMDRRIVAPSPEALAWTKRARALEAGLLTNWLAQF
jgi:serine-type D-Ala-D-Ala carboxypeptidase/endopeptidase (penicillin-binding protein 4)